MIDLFNSELDPASNLLPKDGIVNYFGSIFSRQECADYFESLSNEISWEHDRMILFGKEIITKRKVAWVGDAPYEYTYSNTLKTALPWTDTLRSIKRRIEDKTNEKFNSCLLNLYHSGEEGMAWHSDNEKELKPNGAIASLSFGAERKFAFKHKHSKETVAIQLENGSLLVMKGETQTYWLHRLPPTTKVKAMRINLTFRTIRQ